MIDIGELKTLLCYDPNTGIFRWKVSQIRGCVQKGRLAGSKTSDGRWRIVINKKQYAAPRLAFAIMIGRWPKADIDHIDRDRLNNKWSNLREATRTQNHANRGNIKPHSSRFKGVSYYPSLGRWRARIKKDYKLICLGYYDSEEIAHAAYMTAARELFGQFATEG